MIVNEKDLRFCLEKAREINDQYALYSLVEDATERSIDDLIYIVKQYHHDKDIVINDLHRDHQGSGILAVCLVLPDRYEIQVLNNLPVDLKRLVVAKELFQTVLDTEDSRNGDIDAHLRAVSDMFIRDESEPECPAVWEELAVIAALEFLYPYKERRVLESVAEIQRAARRYGVPTRYIEMFSTGYAIEFFGKLA